jgi:hypothetical protein
MSDYIKLGGIWKNKDSKGQDYYGIEISLKGQTYKLSVFKNQFKKEGDKAPDWTIHTRDAEIVGNIQRKIPIETTFPLKSTAVTSDEDCPF